MAFELKIDEFKPEYLGKMNFYLEALDRDVRRSNENPSIGIILCKGKNEDVVEYAMSKSASQAKIADYSTQLIDKAIFFRRNWMSFMTLLKILKCWKMSDNNLDSVLSKLGQDEL